MKSVSHLFIIFFGFLFFTACTVQKNEKILQSGTANVVINPNTALLGIISENFVNIGHNAMNNVPESAATKSPSATVIYVSKTGRGYAFIEEVKGKFRVVHNGKAGKLYDQLETNNLVVSPDGKRVAYSARIVDKWYAVIDEKELAMSAEGGSIVFSDDSQHVAYEQKFVDKWYTYIDTNKSHGALGYFNPASFVANSKKVVLVEYTSEVGAFTYDLVISDLHFKRKDHFQIYTPENITINNSKTALAAVQNVNGKRRVVSFDFEHTDKYKFGALYDDVQKPTISEDGSIVSYIAKQDGKYLLVMNDKEEYIDPGTYLEPPAINQAKRTVSIPVSIKNNEYIYNGFSKDSQRIIYERCSNIIYSNDGMHQAYIAIKNGSYLLVVDGKESQLFELIVSPMFSPDGSKIVFKSLKKDNRFVVTMDLNAQLVKQSTNYERIFEINFTADGKSIAYGAKEGDKLWWKVEAL